MFLRLLSIENAKIFRRVVVWAELLLLASMLGGGYFLLTIRGPIQPELQLPNVLNDNPFFAITAGYGFGGLMLVVLVATAVAQDYGWGTLNLLVARGVPRPWLLLAKLLVLPVPAVLVALSAQLGVCLASVLVTLLHGGSLVALGQVAWGKVLEGILITAYTMLPYGALAFLCAVVTRSPVATMAVGAGYGLIGEMIVAQLLVGMGAGFARVIPYLPIGLARGLATHIWPDPFPGLLPSGLAAAGIAVYTLVLLVLAMLVFQRQDLGSGT